MYASIPEIRAIRSEAIAHGAPKFAALCDKALEGDHAALVSVTAGIESLDWPWASELEGK